MSKELQIVKVSVDFLHAQSVFGQWIMNKFFIIDNILGHIVPPRYIEIIISKIIIGYSIFFPYRIISILSKYCPALVGAILEFFISDFVVVKWMCSVMHEFKVIIPGHTYKEAIYPSFAIIPYVPNLMTIVLSAWISVKVVSESKSFFKWWKYDYFSTFQW